MGFNKDAVAKRRRPKDNPDRQQTNEAPDRAAAEYRGRARAEADRYKLAVDGGFYCVFCFRDADRRDAFDKIVGAKNGYCFGDELEHLFEKRGRSGRAVGLKRIRGARVKSPLESVEYTGDLEVDCFAEAAAILAALESVERRESYDNVYDSCYSTCAIFRSHDALVKFLRDWGLYPFGEKFTDGEKALELLGA